MKELHMFLLNTILKRLNWIVFYYFNGENILLQGVNSCAYFWKDINHRNMDNSDFYEPLTMETVTFS